MPVIPAARSGSTELPIRNSDSWRDAHSRHQAKSSMRKLAVNGAALDLDADHAAEDSARSQACSWCSIQMYVIVRTPRGAARGGPALLVPGWEQGRNPGGGWRRDGTYTGGRDAREGLRVRAGSAAGGTAADGARGAGGSRLPGGSDGAAASRAARRGRPAGRRTAPGAGLSAARVDSGGAHRARPGARPCPGRRARRGNRGSGRLSVGRRPGHGDR